MKIFNDDDFDVWLWPTIIITVLLLIYVASYIRGLPGTPVH